MNKTTTALAVAAPQPTTLSIASVISDEGIWNRANMMGRALMKTSYLGKGTSEFGATMAVVTMAKNNMDPVEFSRAYNMINDKPEMKPNYALGLFKAAGGKYKMNRVDEDVCDMEFTAPDGTFAHVEVKMEKMLATDVPWTTDAQGNRVLKANWRNHPDDMLFARCTGKALRRVWPEHMGGMYMAGEIDAEEPAATPNRRMTNAEMLSRVRAAAAAPSTPAAPIAPAPVAEPVEAEVVAAPSPLEAAADTAFASVESAPAAVAVPVPVVEDTSAAPAAPIPASTVDTSDPSICPIRGQFYGVKFIDMEPDILTFMLDPTLQSRRPEVTQAHIDCARAAFDELTNAATNAAEE